MSQDEFCTPPRVASRLHRFFGGAVGLDPATNARSIIKSKLRYTAGALHRQWRPPATHNSVFDNVPFSDPNLLLFAERGINQRFEWGFEHVRLVPVATSTAWWAIARGRRPTSEGIVTEPPSIVFTGRLKFIDLNGTVSDDTARFDCAILYYGTSTKRHREFLSIFGEPELCNDAIDATPTVAVRKSAYRQAQNGAHA